MSSSPVAGPSWQGIGLSLVRLAQRVEHCALVTSHVGMGSDDVGPRNVVKHDPPTVWIDRVGIGHV